MSDRFIDFLNDASTHGTDPALADANQSITYDELYTLARKAANALYQNYARHRYLLLEAESTVNFVVTLLGAMYGNIIPIPIDPRMPATALRKFSDTADGAPVIKSLTREAIDHLSIDKTCGPTSSTALVMLTSGTSGSPKGVLISNENLVHSCRTISQYLNYPMHSSTAVVLPLYYSYSLISQLLCQLSVGGYVRLFPNLRNVIGVARDIAQFDIQTFCGVPSTFTALTRFNVLRPIRFPSVKVVCSAGAAITRRTLLDIKTLFPDALVFNNYGMTEASPRISYIRSDDERFYEESCGTPITGLDLFVVDPITHAVLADGEEGVIAIRGPNVTSGYLNDEATTAKAFTRDGLLLTGDLGCVRDGYIYLRGRNDDIFNVSGEKVSPVEIEAALEQLPQVTQAAVRGTPDAARGHVPIAYLLLSAPTTRDVLLEEMQARVRPCAIPVRYFSVSRLPMTSNGKLQRRILCQDGDYILGEIK